MGWASYTEPMTSPAIAPSIYRLKKTLHGKIRDYGNRFIRDVRKSSLQFYLHPLMNCETLQIFITAGHYLPAIRNYFVYTLVRSFLVVME